jgi:HlyD family secretion protein
MTAQLRIAVRDARGILKIPSQALRFRPNDAGAASDQQAVALASSPNSATVWIIGHGGQPSPVAVRLGASDDTSTELLESQLGEKQQVIVGTANATQPRTYFGLRLGF